MNKEHVAQFCFETSLITYSSGGSSISIPPEVDLKQPIGNSSCDSPRSLGVSSKHPLRPSAVGARSLNLAQTWANLPNTSKQIGSGLAPVTKLLRNAEYQFARNKTLNFLGYRK